MPNINIGGSASTSIGLGMGTGWSSGAYIPNFNPWPVPSFVPFTTKGQLAQSMNNVTNSQSQFNQFTQNLQQQMYGLNPTQAPSSISGEIGSNVGNSWLKSDNAKSVMNTIGGVMNIANNAIFANSNSNRSAGDQAASNIRSGMSDVMLKSGDPRIMIAGLTSKIIDGAMDAADIRSNQISKDIKEKTGITGAARFLNNSMNYIPGNPLAIGGKKLTDAEMSADIDKIRGGFAQTVGNIDAAQSIGGSRINFMLGGSTRNKMNNFIKNRNSDNELLTNASRTNTLRKQNDYALELNSQNRKRSNSNIYQNLEIGKTGLKLPDREMLDTLYAKRVTSFKEGGVIGVDSNVIPEGALHKELNHMEEYNKELDKVITDKGIAVITTDKESKIEQVAEIEKEEIVFRLELTKKIEELWHEGTPEAMLKAGKLLVKEIIGNTDDNTEEILDGNN